MRHEMTVSAGGAELGRRAVRERWTRPLVLLAIGFAATLAATLADWRHMAAQWWGSSTYNHILLVPPVVAWLVAQRWPALRRLEPRGWWPGLAGFAAAAAIWLLGTMAGADLISQVGAVGMVAALVPLILGPRVAAGLAFPLGYLAFLVPFGDEFVKPLQLATAGITVALTHLSGIPATIDGVFIATPAGLFEVAEACSGVKFLVAMVAFGVLAANVCFTSVLRRTAMIAACVIVPILANGVRAWGTVYAAQWFGVKAAAGFDHIVYGWIFFALIVALVLGVAWRFFDRPAGDPAVDGERLARSEWLGRVERFSVPGGVGLVAALAVLFGAASWTAAAARLHAPMPARIALPVVPGWQRADYAPRAWWEPQAAGAAHRLLGRYADAGGRRVDVFIALYDGQGEGREASGFGQGALTAGTAWAWQAPGPRIGAGRSEWLLGEGGARRLAVTYYRNGSLLTGSGLRLRLASLADDVTLHPGATAMLILSAQDDPDRPAAAAIEAFRASTGPLDQWLDRTVAGL